MSCARLCNVGVQGRVLVEYLVSVVVFNVGSVGGRWSWLVGDQWLGSCCTRVLVFLVWLMRASVLMLVCKWWQGLVCYLLSADCARIWFAAYTWVLAAPLTGDPYRQGYPLIFNVGSAEFVLLGFHLHILRGV